MRIETGSNQLRIIGKGWQVRAVLRQLAQHNLTVAQYIERINSSQTTVTTKGVHTPKENTHVIDHTL
ncbi:hypothetical protein [Mechercharimyces sp. CAU 1602]|uniref:hypothetical protein n=1 Tax=Mechercharimyces sp. CAU 1602 TaxID=2973933 RepID=UPI002161613E|nr:hypothetical protein [Mechercharimyces sp. CAU 1602]MCS1350830.1 hypothetical protein [Mechercharimyces sp. CAU 1602]